MMEAEHRITHSGSPRIIHLYLQTTSHVECPPHAWLHHFERFQEQKQESNGQTKSAAGCDHVLRHTDDPSAVTLPSGPATPGTAGSTGRSRRRTSARLPRLFAFWHKKQELEAGSTPFSSSINKRLLSKGTAQ